MVLLRLEGGRVTTVEQALLLRLGLAVLREHEILEADLAAGRFGSPLVDAVGEVGELLDTWRNLRFSPSGAMLLYPSDEAYEPGAGPCAICREPGEGALCGCMNNEPPGDLLAHVTRTGALLLPILAASGGALCSRSRCPRYLVQPAIPGTDGTARAVCEMTGTTPGTHCCPRALDIVEQVHARKVATRA